MAKKHKRKPPKDFAILHGPTEDGEGARVLRFKQGAVYAGEVRPLREGQPLGQNEVVRLRPLDAHAGVCEVEVLHAPAIPAEAAQEPPSRGQGPARVASGSYRRNWSAIFGAKSKTRTDWSLN